MADIQIYKTLLPNNPLCGISTYKDTLNLATGACTRQIKKYVFTGNESWILFTQWKGTNTSVFYYNQTDMINIVDNTKIYVLSDKFEAVSRDGLYNGDTDMIAKTGSNAMTIRVSDSIATTLTAFKQWLSENPVTVWYVLATPTSETITVPIGLTGTEEGYLTQSGTPTPASPIYPTANVLTGWWHSLQKFDGTTWQNATVHEF